MHGDDRGLRPARVEDLAAIERELDREAEQRAGRRRSEADQEAWTDEAQLFVDPRLAGVDLGDGRRLVDAPLAAAFEAEVLDRVGQVDVLAIDADLVEDRVEQ